VDGSRSALIVANDSYTDPGLSRLRAPDSDAQALARVLRDPDIGDFEVRVLLNEPAHEVNLAVEEFFADRRPDDLLLVHFSCHGVKDESGELFFAAANTRLRRLGATAVAAEFVNRRMNRSRSRRVVLLLDCCYAGAFERGMTARAGTGIGIGEQFGGRGRAVITASSAMEYAFEVTELAREAAGPRSSPRPWYAGWRPGRPTAMATGACPWTSCTSTCMSRSAPPPPISGPDTGTSRSLATCGSRAARRCGRCPCPRSCSRPGSIPSLRSGWPRSRSSSSCSEATTPGWPWPPGRRWSV
jgi:hypothetical protein